MELIGVVFTMKSVGLLVFVLTIKGTSSQNLVKDHTLDQVRHQFYLSTLDYQHAFPLIERLNNLEDPGAILLAYKGATEAILAKPGWNVFKKIRHLKNSRKFLQQAVDRNDQDLEIRFLRLAVEHHIPKYLGYSNHIEQDKNIIMGNLNRFNNKRLPKEIADYIIRFSEESGLYNFQEQRRVKQVLAD